MSAVETAGTQIDSEQSLPFCQELSALSAILPEISSHFCISGDDKSPMFKSGNRPLMIFCPSSCPRSPKSEAPRGFFCKDSVITGSFGNLWKDAPRIGFQGSVDSFFSHVARNEPSQRIEGVCMKGFAASFVKL
jgi:hypothetical protein